jgi:hypothetical protein
MVFLAGGFAAMEALGVSEHEVGMGIEKAGPDMAAKLAAQFEGTTPSDFDTFIVGGDFQAAFDLVDKVSGCDDEAGAYFGWLARRTRNLLRHPRFWPAVEAVAHALCESDRLSRRSVREVIAQAAEKQDSARATVVTNL